VVNHTFSATPAERLQHLSALDETLDQVTRRLPSSRDTFQNLSKLSPKVVLHQLSRPAFSELPFLQSADENISKIEIHFRKLPFVHWHKKVVFNNGAPTVTEQFWAGVLEQSSFKELATFVLTCLVTP